MGQIKTRIIIKPENESSPVITTDFEMIKTLNIPGDPTYRYIHLVEPGTPLTLPDGKNAEITSVSCNFFDMEYKNEGIYVNSYGKRFPYNFEVIIKVKLRE